MGLLILFGMAGLFGLGALIYGLIDNKRLSRTAH
jgi:hypothetical protein